MEDLEVMGQVEVGLIHVSDGRGCASDQQRSAPVLMGIGELLGAEGMKVDGNRTWAE